MEDQKALVSTEGNRSSVTIYDKFSDPIVAIEKLGKWINDSGMFGCDSGKPSQGMMLAWAAVTEKKNPFDIAKEYHIVEGRLSKRADAMLADFCSRGTPRRVKWLTKMNDTERAAFEITDKNGEAYTMEYTFADAQEAGYCYTYKEGKQVLKRAWQMNKSDLLRARLISKTVRMIEPDIAVGLYTPEEIKDFDNNEEHVDQPHNPLFTRTTEAEVVTTIKNVNNQSVVTPANSAPTQSAQTSIPIAEMRKILKDRLEPEALYVDKFFVSKKYLQPGEAFPAMDDRFVEKVYKNYDELMKIYGAWKTAQINREKAALASGAVFA